MKRFFVFLTAAASAFILSSCQEKTTPATPSGDEELQEVVITATCSASKLHPYIDDYYVTYNWSSDDFFYLIREGYPDYEIVKFVPVYKGRDDEHVMQFHAFVGYGYNFKWGVYNRYSKVDSFGGEYYEDKYFWTTLRTAQSGRADEMIAVAHADDIVMYGGVEFTQLTTAVVMYLHPQTAAWLSQIKFEAYNDYDEPVNVAGTVKGNFDVSEYYLSDATSNTVTVTKSAGTFSSSEAVFVTFVPNPYVTKFKVTFSGTGHKYYKWIDRSSLYWDEEEVTDFGTTPTDANWTARGWTAE